MDLSFLFYLALGASFVNFSNLQVMANYFARDIPNNLGVKPLTQTFEFFLVFVVTEDAHTSCSQHPQRCMQISLKDSEPMVR